MLHPRIWHWHFIYLFSILQNIFNQNTESPGQGSGTPTMPPPGCSFHNGKQHHFVILVSQWGHWKGPVWSQVSICACRVLGTGWLGLWASLWGPLLSCQPSHSSVSRAGSGTASLVLFLPTSRFNIRYFDYEAHWTFWCVWQRCYCCLLSNIVKMSLGKV